MKVLILEDNKYEAMGLERIISTINEKCEVYWCDKASKARQMALNNKISVFIVDVMLNHEKDGDKGGIEYVDDIRSMERYKYTPVIFVTGFEEPKMYSYDSLHCYKYLSKPYRIEEATAIIKEVMELSDRYLDKNCNIMLKDTERIAELKISEIVYVESKNRKFTIMTRSGEHVSYNKTISDIKGELLEHHFFQCSRTTMVNREFIERIDFRNNVIVLKDNYGKISFGRIYKKIIKNEFLDNILR